MTELQVLNYEPNKRETPRLANVGSAWGNIPTILKDIIERFDIKTESAIEFGVEYGYSTSALSNYFENVTGVDIFDTYFHIIKKYSPPNNFKLVAGFTKYPTCRSAIKTFAVFP